MRGPLARVLTWTGIGCAGFLAVAGGLALRGPGLVAVGLGSVLAASTAAGLAHESAAPGRRSTLESAVQAACWTVGALLVLAGIGALAGVVVAVLCLGVVLVGLFVRYGFSRPAAAPQQNAVLRFPVAAPGEGTGSLRPVAVLATADLGLEWIRTTRALAGRLEAPERAALAQRRQEVLDELERRDPDGFARWLAAGPTAGSDPSDYVRGGPLLGGSAETDAA